MSSKIAVLSEGPNNREKFADSFFAVEKGKLEMEPRARQKDADAARPPPPHHSHTHSVGTKGPPKFLRQQLLLQLKGEAPAIFPRRRCLQSNCESYPRAQLRATRTAHMISILNLIITIILIPPAIFAMCQCTSVTPPEHPPRRSRNTPHVL